MDALLGKLTNLSYEAFGVILPGLVFGVFILLWWSALGSLAPLLTRGHVPHLTLGLAAWAINAVPGGIVAATAISAVMGCYFLGHFVNWPSKAHPRDGGWRPRLQRVWSFLRFKIESPKDSYSAALQPLFDAVAPKVTHDGNALTWRQFYPLAKTIMSNSGRHSLIATYQNKYTLHRSLAFAAALLFWLSIGGLLAGLLALARAWGALPHWFELGLLCVGSLLLVTAYSGSYRYSWSLWGDTVITETYALAFPLQSERKG